ncbi:Hypothetical predicted protein, partial [Olea europaea subsp. europaea]
WSNTIAMWQFKRRFYNFTPIHVGVFGGQYSNRNDEICFTTELPLAIANNQHFVSFVKEYLQPRYVMPERPVRYR